MSTPSGSNVPNALKICNKSISFPYINKNAHNDPVNRLLVDIIDYNSDNLINKSNFYTSTLKYVYCEFYCQYSQYLQKHNYTTLQEEIKKYYNTILLTEIEYKYKIGQFGYVYNGNSLEKSFVMITGKLDANKEVFFLHDQLTKYKYHNYDITSPTPKILTDDYTMFTGWTIQSLFIPIDGTIKPETNDKSKNLIELLNWKICRVDYLLKKMNRMKLKLSENEMDYVNENSNATEFKQGTDETLSPTDDEETSYFPDSDRSSYYTSTDVSPFSTVSPTNGYKQPSTDDDSKLLLLADFGYYKERHLSYTLKGELFVAINKNNKNGNEEEVTIKKMIPYENANGFRIVIDAHLVKEALISRNLQTKNTLVADSIVKYIDFFQSKSHYFSVMETDFSMNLKEFVTKSLKYIKNGKLALSEYYETIKYLLWRLSATIYWLHNMKCSDLDVCVENIMLSQAEFKRNSDGSVTINLKIEMKFIDLGVQELLEMCNENDNEFKTNVVYNEQYLELENEQYVAPQNKNNKYYDPSAADIWSFGMVIYYCFFGNYPYNEIPNNNNYTNESGKLNEYIKTKSAFKFIDPAVISLINGCLCIDETKRLKSVDILQHKWFNSFYKAYLSVVEHNKTQ